MELHGQVLNKHPRHLFKVLAFVSGPVFISIQSYASDTVGAANRQICMTDMTAKEKWHTWYKLAFDNHGYIEWFIFVLFC